MLDRKVLAIAFAAAMAACSGGGEKKSEGGPGTPEPGPSGGGGGASNQVGSIVGRGGVAGAGGASAGNGGQGGTLFAGADRTLIRFKTEAGLPAKPTWTRPAVALGANPRVIGASASLTAGGVVKGDDGTSAATSLWVKSGVTLTFDADAPSIVQGPVIVEGTVDAGQTGFLVISATHLAVAPGGALLARGQDGGDGGQISVLASEGVWVFGTVDVRGSDGDTTGGEGGGIFLGIDPTRPDLGTATVVVDGDLDASGGTAATGPGGGGGSVVIGLSPDEGGGGGVFRASARRARPVPTPAIAVHLTGSAVAHGANGKGGGSGGLVAIHGTTATVVAGTVDVSGGGATQGLAGSGGRFDAGVFGGPVWVEGGVNARGGDAGSAAAATGGLVAIGSAGSLLVDADPSVVHLSADVDVSGGGGASGGAGGSVQLFGFAGVTVVASEVDVSGSASATSGFGGGGGIVSVESSDGDGGYGLVTVATPILADAGDGGSGGQGGMVVLAGSETACGAIEANGGESLGDAMGGDGGAIEVYSDDDVTSAIGAPLSVVRGNGAEPGAHGTVTVDSVVKALVGGVYTP